MKKNVLALSIAALVAGFAGSAYAVLPAAGAIDATGATATKLRFGNTGTGNMLVVPYFSTQNGNSTLLSIVNTNETVGKAVKVRFRGAANSDDVYDFQVFLSPGDVWTANISADETTGLSYLKTSDKSCTKPATSVLNSTPFVTARLNGTDAVKANNTREGYIEIFNMADIPASATGVYPLIKHDASGNAACANITGNTSWTAINTNMSVGDLATNGLTNPNTGLAANWTIINVPKAVAWSGAAAAIEAVTAADVLAPGNVVYFPQVSTAIDTATALLYTADPLLQGATPPVSGALYDLPDMSTPYTGAVTASAQAIDLTKAIAAKSVMNEYWTDPSIHAATDWVFSMPTRRYAVAVNYKASPLAMVQNSANVGYFDAATNLKLNGDQICVKGIVPSPWDREEKQPAAPDDVVISPSTPGEPLLFCGETSVLTFNQAGAAASGVLSATVAVKDIAAYQDGWLKLNTPGAVGGNGLPILGQAFVAAFNPALPDGTSGNFNMGWEHRYTR